MNRINFNQTGGFPLDTNVLGFMQMAYQLFNALGELAGELSILQGCEQIGSTVSDGVVYINGEVLPFKGGYGANVIVKSEKHSLPFEDGSSKPVEEVRYATFGMSSTSYKWSDFKRLDNLQKLMNDLKNHEHKWEDISGKPTAFPPVAHSHNYNDLTNKPSLGGQIVVAGKVGCNPRRVITRFRGSFSVSSCPSHSGSECHKIVHNLGHTDYVVTGAALQSNGAKNTVKFNCFSVAANHCYVITADDDTGNASDFIFQITSFK